MIIKRKKIIIKSTRFIFNLRITFFFHQVMIHIILISVFLRENISVWQIQLFQLIKYAINNVLIITSTFYILSI